MSLPDPSSYARRMPNHSVSLHILVEGSLPCAGSYRQLQTRLRNNAESVAFYGGIEKEGGLIRSSFTQLVKHRAKLLRTQWLYSIWQVRQHRVPHILCRNELSYHKCCIHLCQDRLPPLLGL